jgi:hypothetical protein
MDRHLRCVVVPVVFRTHGGADPAADIEIPLYGDFVVTAGTRIERGPQILGGGAS